MSVRDAGNDAYRIREAVFGKDDRVIVPDPRENPWRKICFLQITMPGVDDILKGTGWFAGSKTVITAGHCIYNEAHGWAQNIKIIPGCDGKYYPFNCCDVDGDGGSFKIMSPWKDDSDKSYDYGAIILPDAQLSTQVGYFGLSSLSDNDLKNKSVTISGYPYASHNREDRPVGTQWYTEGCLEIDSNFLYYSTIKF